MTAIMSPWAPLGWDSFSDIPYFLPILRPGQVFCRMSLRWDLSGVFLMV